MPPTHLHWIVWAYESRNEAGGFDGISTLDLLCATATIALSRAEAMVPGRNYRVHQVIEHFDGQPCGKG